MISTSTSSSMTNILEIQRIQSSIAPITLLIFHSSLLSPHVPTALNRRREAFLFKCRFLLSVFEKNRIKGRSIAHNCSHAFARYRISNVHYWRVARSNPQVGVSFLKRDKKRPTRLSFKESSCQVLARNCTLPQTPNRPLVANERD